MQCSHFLKTALLFKNTRLLVAIMISIILLAVCACWPANEDVFVTTYLNDNRLQVFGDLYKGQTFVQQFTNPEKDVKYISIQLATYRKTSIDGDITVKIYDNDKKVMQKLIPGKSVYDWCKIHFEVPKSIKKGNTVMIRLTSTNSLQDKVAILISKQSKYNETVVENNTKKISGIMPIGVGSSRSISIWWVWLVANLYIMYYLYIIKRDNTDVSLLNTVFALLISTCVLFALRSSINGYLSL